MDELIKMVTQQAGIDEKTARTVVEMVLKHLQKNLPGPAAASLQGFLEGKDLGEAQGMLGKLMGMFKK